MDISTQKFNLATHHRINELVMVDIEYVHPQSGLHQLRIIF